jgi:putative membrane protein
MSSIFATRAVLLSSLGLAAVIGAGCGTSVDLRTGMGAGPGTSAVQATVAPLSAAERDFAIRIATQGFYEVEVSRLATERAVNLDVRAYAQMMVKHHTQANNELVALMSAKGVTPPNGLAADKKEKLYRLASLPPSAAFDNGYVRVVGIEDHRTSIAVFERARRESKDRDLLAWIDRALLAMRSHLAAAQSLAGTLDG